jgi:undecaprenyl diphosphate synthase
MSAPLQHIGFIMDGNGRWATRQNLPRLAGHKAGVEAVRRVVTRVAELQIPYMSLYAFSTENWKRPIEEVSGIFNLFESFFDRELARFNQQNVRIVFLGDHRASSPLKDSTKTLMAKAVASTANNTGTTLMVGLNYGGHDELVRAAQKLQTAGTPITAQALEAALDTAAAPPLDMVIRTSGEQRLSGFMPWQSAYAELYFPQTHWPDFDAAAVDEALAWYAGRQRRFGGLPGAAPGAAAAVQKA